MDDTKPWYQSTTIWGALIAGLATLAQLFGVNIADLTPALTSGILGVTGLIGTIIAIIGRVRARTIVTATK